MTELEEYQRWLTSEQVDTETKEELKALQNDPKELQYRFYKMLDFGTAGLRGVMGAGLNMMNIYTVRYATQGLADLILGCGGQDRGVAIAYDSRHRSKEFAKEAACTLAANGIRVYLFDELRPTPELSFAIRETGSIAGINVTASHNPKEYNGYKVYWEDGAQLPPDHAAQISGRLAEIDLFRDVKTCTLEEAVEKNLVTVLSREMDEKYLENVLAQSVGREAVEACAAGFKVVYTPFHGAGYRLVPEALRRLGLREILTVPQQMELDGAFPTVKNPNPEEKEGFRLAIALAKEAGCDLIIGTDPDADRVGIVVRDTAGEYRTMSGNQVGVLLLDYLIRRGRESGKLPQNAAAIKSIVSTDMAKAVCERQGVTLLNVLTGFKYIGEKIKEFEQTGEHTFLFGFEESYGYLAGTYARDKDAVVASMLIAEMACWYRLKRMSLYDAMQALYREYGWYDEQVVSVAMSGLSGLERIREAGERLRRNPPSELGGLAVSRIRDYLGGSVLDCSTGAQSPTGLPRSDVLFYELEDGSSLVVRPSGTEPKIKLYVLVKADSEGACAQKKERLAQAGKALLAL